MTKIARKLKMQSNILDIVCVVLFCALPTFLSIKNGTLCLRDVIDWTMLVSVIIVVDHIMTRHTLNSIMIIETTGENVVFTTLDNKLYVYKLKDITKIIYNEYGYKITANGKTLRVNKHDYNLKVISNDNIRDYISFADFPYAQYEEGEFYLWRC